MGQNVRNVSFELRFDSGTGPGHGYEARPRLPQIALEIACGTATE